MSLYAKRSVLYALRRRVKMTYEHILAVLPYLTVHIEPNNETSVTKIRIFRTKNFHNGFKYEL